MELVNQKNKRTARGAVMTGRTFVLLAFLALIGAWVTQATGTTFLGLSQEHLFYDSIALSLISVVLFLDAFAHEKNY